MASLALSLIRMDEEEVGGEEHENGLAGVICGASNSSCLLQPPPDCEADECSERFTIIIFPFLALIIGVVSVQTARNLRIPYTLFLLLIGIILGVLGCGVNLGLLSVSLQQWVHLNPPTIFFYVFLAPLIFEASFNTRWHVFKRLLIPILTAAFVIVILQAGLIAAFQQLIVRYDEWSWWAALMFGAMLSATDPISVTSTLKALGASEYLNTLIEGESLVNDGSAFVLWEAMIENTEEPGALSIGEIVLRIFRLSVGGMLMGVAFGIVALIILGLVYDEFEVETSLTVIVAFLGFWTAQSPSKLSGVICNVASGLVISAFGRHLITPAVRGPLAEFWELLSWIANTIVFVHAGVLLSAFTWSCAGTPNTTVDYLLVPGYFLFLQVIRIGLMLLFKPLMAVGNQWYRWKESIVVGFSGLRGAVSLVLALEVAGSEEIPEEVRSRIVLWTTGIVFLSLLINGFFVKPLIQVLRLDKAKKSREEFLHRARAVMVQRSLTILDALCIETGFKAARWSYVVKNILPAEWLEEQEHAEGYRDALEQIMDNTVAQSRRSLENVRMAQVRKIVHNEFNRRLSVDMQSLKSPSPQFTPQLSSQFARPVDVTSVSMTPGVRSGIASPRGGQPQVVSPSALSSDLNQQIVPLSLGVAAVGGGRYSLDGPNRRSIDADLIRYNRSVQRRLSQSELHKEVTQLHKMAVAGEKIELTERDREVQRRLLTAILSHVRAMSNASFVEFNVLYNLEQDVQFALDANDEGKDYDLLSFLDNSRSRPKQIFRKAYLRAVEGKRLRGESSMTTAIVIFGILTEILKAEILHSSPVVQLEAERLYEGAAALLNRLESLNPLAFEWVESQFAIYISAIKQNDVLEDMLQSGIVDEQEYKVIHHELIEVRRKHARSRQSLFSRRASQLPPHPKPRVLKRAHPLFAGLGPEQMAQIVDRYGELVHLKSGQALQCEKGSLVVVLEGAIRPLEDTVLPKDVASQIKRSSTEMDVAVHARVSISSPHYHPHSPPIAGQNRSNSSGTTDEDNRDDDNPGFTPLASGASMYWCFPANSAFCGPIVTLHAHNANSGGLMAVASERAIDTHFCCCEISKSATVFTLPVAQVQKLARESFAFRMEITRSLAREIVLESVADQRPYSLSHFTHSFADEEDVHSVVGRAFRVLERLPYMTVLALEAGENSTAHVQGPGVLLNGTVRVSIVDTSGLIGAINLLHEELTGPALLPAGGLIIQEVHKADDPTVVRFASMQRPSTLTSGTAVEASTAAAEILELGETEAGRAWQGKGSSPVLAHVLIEEITGSDQTTIRRLQRWTGSDTQIDMNGRFGMFRQIDLSPLEETKVE